MRLFDIHSPNEYVIGKLLTIDIYHRLRDLQIKFCRSTMIPVEVVVQTRKLHITYHNNDALYH